MGLTASNCALALDALGVTPAEMEAAADLFGSRELAEALSSQTAKPGDKYAVTDKLFPEKLRNFIKFLADCGSTELFPEIYKEYLDIRNRGAAAGEAELIYRTPPTEEQKERIKRRISEIWGIHDPELRLTQDDSLIGGFIIRVGDEEIDYSLKGRLESLGRNLERR